MLVSSRLRVVHAALLQMNRRHHFLDGLQGQVLLHPTHRLDFHLDGWHRDVHPRLLHAKKQRLCARHLSHMGDNTYGSQRLRPYDCFGGRWILTPHRRGRVRPVRVQLRKQNIEKALLFFLLLFFRQQNSPPQRLFSLSICGRDAVGMTFMLDLLQSELVKGGLTLKCEVILCRSICHLVFFFLPLTSRTTMNHAVAHSPLLVFARKRVTVMGKLCVPLFVFHPLTP